MTVICDTNNTIHTNTNNLFFVITIIARFADHLVRVCFIRNRICTYKEKGDKWLYIVVSFELERK